MTKLTIFRPCSLRKIRFYPLQAAQLRAICSKTEQHIFGNFGYRIRGEKAAALSYSLLFVKAEKAVAVCKKTPNPMTSYPKIQIRLEFHYQSTEYDFPVTDVDFLRRYDENLGLLENAEAFLWASNTEIGIINLVAGILAI
ncbi:MAG: hypothetical protein AAF849_03680 [Bacteroidota bacterium]